MFDVGFGKLALIAIVALLVLGPERLPRVARTAGALVRRARNSWLSVRGEIERELAAEDMKRQVEDAMRAGDVRAEVDAAAQTIRRSVEPAAPAPLPPAGPAATPAAPAPSAVTAPAPPPVVDESR
ncbi:MAG TPA: Sec-independent protein translocase protein TatB [Dokdonella sp.]|uniref:Sec-independent protein translocase protein TatB n=1 Tax=Dokdonella sp. TaxID=2291710 RepID=UPI002B8299FB|nr:Sec-independent protein translocase protein TatB [Dokdonella sp.]HUD42893.1 Sec-independent protein translocase protein TatB [Dokdonella sp.]